MARQGWPLPGLITVCIWGAVRQAIRYRRAQHEVARGGCPQPQTLHLGLSLSKRLGATSDNSNMAHSPLPRRQSTWLGLLCRPILGAILFSLPGRFRSWRFSTARLLNCSTVGECACSQLDPTSREGIKPSPQTPRVTAHRLFLIGASSINASSRLSPRQPLSFSLAVTGEERKDQSKIGRKDAYLMIHASTFPSTAHEPVKFTRPDPPDGIECGN